METGTTRDCRPIGGKEKVSFSLHETILYAVALNDFWYAHHIEAVFVFEG